MEVPGQFIREEDTKIVMRTAMGDSCSFNVVRGCDLGFETHTYAQIVLKLNGREFKMLQLRRELRSDWSLVELIGSDLLVALGVICKGISKQFRK